MSGGKGGRSTTSVEIPAWLEGPARTNIARADEIGRIGYVPYYGPDVAAMTPMQLAAGGNINAAASEFGLGVPASVTAGMPMAQDFGGMTAYSSAPIYQQSLAQLEALRPAQFAALNAPFINPVTGEAPAAPFSPYATQLMANQLTQTQASNSGVGSSREGSFASGSELTRQAQGPIPASGALAESGLRADLTRSLTDPFYDPPGNVVSRALGITSPQARPGDSIGGRK